MKGGRHCVATVDQGLENLRMQRAEGTTLLGVETLATAHIDQVFLVPFGVVATESSLTPRAISNPVLFD